MAKFYEYAKCTTCVKARKWLEKNHVKIETIPIVETPPSRADLQDYWKKSGLDLKKMFNTSGQVYREMKLSEKLPVMSHSEMLELLASNGKLIKRPILVDGATVLVGFDEKKYAAHFKT